MVFRLLADENTATMIDNKQDMVEVEEEIFLSVKDRRKKFQVRDNCSACSGITCASPHNVRTVTSPLPTTRKWQRNPSEEIVELTKVGASLAPSRKSSLSLTDDSTVDSAKENAPTDRTSSTPIPAFASATLKKVEVPNEARWKHIKGNGGSTIDMSRPLFASKQLKPIVDDDKIRKMSAQALKKVEPIEERWKLKSSGGDISNVQKPPFASAKLTRVETMNVVESVGSAQDFNNEAKEGLKSSSFQSAARKEIEALQSLSYANKTAPNSFTKKGSEEISVRHLARTFCAKTVLPPTVTKLLPIKTLSDNPEKAKTTKPSAAANELQQIRKSLKKSSHEKHRIFFDKHEEPNELIFQRAKLRSRGEATKNPPSLNLSNRSHSLSTVEGHAGLEGTIESTNHPPMSPFARNSPSCLRSTNANDELLPAISTDSEYTTDSEGVLDSHGEVQYIQISLSSGGIAEKCAPNIGVSPSVDSADSDASSLATPTISSTNQLVLKEERRKKRDLSKKDICKRFFFGKNKRPSF